VADPNSDDCNPATTFVACVSDEKILRASLLAPRCLMPGSIHEVILASRSGAHDLRLFPLVRARPGSVC
jgi:hypothetical protein